MLLYNLLQLPSPMPLTPRLRCSRLMLTLLLASSQKVSCNLSLSLARSPSLFLSLSYSWFLSTGMFGPFTLQLGLGLCSAWLGMSMSWYIYICCLAQTWIRGSTSSSLQTHHLSAILPDHNSMFQIADVIQWNASGIQSFSRAKQSMACTHPRMAKCLHSIPSPAWAHARFFC